MLRATVMQHPQQLIPLTQKNLNYSYNFKYLNALLPHATPIIPSNTADMKHAIYFFISNKNQNTQRPNISFNYLKSLI